MEIRQLDPAVYAGRKFTARYRQRAIMTSAPRRTASVSATSRSERRWRSPLTTNSSANGSKSR